MLPDGLRRLAETPDRYTLLPDDVERFADERVCVLQGPTWAGVIDVHVTAGDVATLVEQVRELVPGEKDVTWWIGESAEPPDLHERLVELGLEVATKGPVIHALACAVEPPPGPPDVDVRVVETYDDFLTSFEVMWDAFATPDEQRERERPFLRGSFESARKAGVPVTFLATIDGSPAGTGRSVYSELGVFLIAGAVLPAARGRGVYRALVRARWDDAVARGTPGLATEAMPDTSYPILKGLGFEHVCTIRRLKDPR